MSAIASVQWVLSSWMTWHLFQGRLAYIMYTEENTYMEIAVPATIAFNTGLFLFGKTGKIPWETIQDRVKEQLFPNQNLPWILIIVGFAFFLTTPFLPASLAFFGYLMGNLRFIGAIALLFTETRLRMPGIFLVFGHAFFKSIETSFFHEIILWGSFFGLFYLWVFKVRPWKQWAIFVTALALLFFIQITKHDYRQVIWFNHTNNSSLQLYIQLIHKKISTGTLWNFDNMHGALARINQGWIHSRIIQQIPENQYHARGKTIQEAIQASLLPRLVDSDKKKAGGKENFEQFTGFTLQPGVSMGISLLGEGYANFGRTGCCIFLFMIGLLYRFVFIRYVNAAVTNPFLLFFLPLVFFQVVKAETELVVVLNHLVKSLLFTLFFLSILKKTLPLSECT